MRALERSTNCQIRRSDYVISHDYTHMEPSGWGYSKQMDPKLRENITLGLLVLQQSGLDRDVVLSWEAGRSGGGIESNEGKCKTRGNHSMDRPASKAIA